jgi:hypothetical protein
MTLEKSQKQKLVDIICQHKEDWQFIRGRSSDRENGRCAWGLILSHYGWDGQPWWNVQDIVEDRRGIANDTVIAAYRSFLKDMGLPVPSDDILRNNISDATPPEINNILYANDMQATSFDGVKSFLKHDWGLE